MESITPVVEKLVEVTRDVFSGMVMMDIVHVGEIRTTSDLLIDSITGMVGLAGSCRGVLAVHVPFHLACAITGNFLGMDIREMNEDVHDAIGEIANMLGGNVKSALAEDAGSIRLSLPSTISGDEYTFITSKENVERVILPFTVLKGTFLVDLEMDRGNTPFLSL